MSLNSSKPPDSQEEAFSFTVQQLPEKEYAEPTTTRTGRFNLFKWILSISSSNYLVKSFENFFRWEGETVSKNSIPVILISLLLGGLGCAGLPFLEQENNMIRLWIPQNSDTALNYAWLWSNYPPEFREHTIILHGDNVLTPPAIQKLYAIYKSVYSIKTEKFNKTWENSCFRRPVVKLTGEILNSRRKRDLWGEESAEDEFGFNNFDENFNAPADFSINNYPQPYCGMVESLPTACFEDSLLELWAFEGEFNHISDEKIAGLTTKEILEKVNNWGYSERFLNEKDYKPLLGGVEYDEAGRISGAKSVYMKWMGRMNSTQAMNPQGPATQSTGTGELVDAETEEFESALATLLLNTRDIEPQEFKIEVNVASSFAQIASSTILGDVTNFVVGFFIVFAYVNIMLGRFNFVEQRMFLSLMGLMSVGIAIFFSYGVCSLMGLQFGPLHNIIPFLILGIGIDDMFVTTQCFSNLPKDGKERSLHERMGCAMKNAGCAITITSITDFIAFIIGGTTVLPALRSFCIFCAIGILAVYFLQATWFIAWFSLDQRRIEEKRNGAIPCYVHVNYTPNKLSQQNIVATMFQHLADIILRKPAKIMLLLLTAALFGISIYGNVELRQEFNPIWFLPSDSYLAQWNHFNSIYYPSRGEQVTVFVGNLDLPSELVNLENMHSELLEQKDIIAEIDSWYLGFKKYMETNFLNGKSLFELEKDEFDRRLTQYLFSPGGSQHRFLFQFNEDLVCGEPSPAPQLSMLSFKHRLMSGPEEQIPAMNRVKTIIRNSHFSSKVFPMAQAYASWETDEVISVELYRNMSLALGCIFITTWILLFNFWACIMVLISVVVTLVNVAGFMHFWGLTIDTVSCTNLIIAIGLCVDYSAHITHTFMVNTGSRERRVKDALTNIGPAVLNGGFSTFLAFILLATSKSHVFTSFFKIFFLVVLFGLYNGLILLPLLLSIFGPRSYSHDDSSSNTPDEIEPLKPIIKPSVVQKENHSSERQVESSDSKP